MLGMTRVGLICAAVLIVLASASSAIPNAAAHTTALPLSEGPHLLGSGASGYWTPQAADLRRLEKDLPRSIADYYRQYIGVVKDGKKQIFINGFSRSVASEFIGGKYDWHRHAVFVYDGGTGFFDATYDPKTRKFTGPRFHGVG